MAALQANGHKVQPFKCGPDFIDPTLHEKITGRISRNLDIRMCGAEFVRHTFNTHAASADIAIVEGVMGMFDGAGASSASLAKLLGLPVALVLDISSCAESAAAILKGFEGLDPACNLKAVILNRVGSQRHLELAKKAIETHCKAEVIGALSRDFTLKLKNRHLGLQMGHETNLERDDIDRLAGNVSSGIDLARLLEITRLKSIQRDDYTENNPQAWEIPANKRIKIAVARDEAFCFQYQDNIDILCRAGAEIVFFSPLFDKALPENIKGVWLGGGYPELYAQKLSGNTTMREAVKTWAEAGGVIYAECGGLMYLCTGIETNGSFFPMAGVFPAKAIMQKKLVSLGYRDTRLTMDSILGPKGALLHGHEFHYSTVDEMPSDIARIYDKRQGYAYKNVLASYIHLHFGQTPEAAEAFVRQCEFSF